MYVYIFLAVKVTPKSIKHSYPLSNCELSLMANNLMEIPADKIKSELNITYSYSVKFEVSHISWLFKIFSVVIMLETYYYS